MGIKQEVPMRTATLLAIFTLLGMSSSGCGTMIPHKIHRFAMQQTEAACAEKNHDMEQIIGKLTAEIDQLREELNVTRPKLVANQRQSDEPNPHVIEVVYDLDTPAMRRFKKQKQLYSKGHRRRMERRGNAIDD